MWKKRQLEDELEEKGLYYFSIFSFFPSFFLFLLFVVQKLTPLPGQFSAVLAEELAKKCNNVQLKQEFLEGKGGKKGDGEPKVEHRRRGMSQLSATRTRTINRSEEGAGGESIGPLLVKRWLRERTLADDPSRLFLSLP